MTARYTRWPVVNPRHHRIATIVTAWLGVALEGSSWQVFHSGIRVHIPAANLYTYPDASVVCGEAVFFQTDSLVNPIVIVEVFSKKFFDYRSIPSLKEYLMVSSSPTASLTAYI